MVTQTNEVVLETDSTIYTNTTGMPGYIANKLATYSSESYSGKKDPKTISASMLNQSIKQILLTLKGIEEGTKQTVDVNTIYSSSIGTLLHTFFYEQFGGEEERAFKTLNDFTISGEADHITRDTKVVVDMKTTSTFVVKKLIQDLALHDPSHTIEQMRSQTPSLFKYTIQLSCYKWLYDLESDIGYIDLVMTNWTKMNLSELGERIQRVELQLFSHKDMKEYLTELLSKVSAYQESGFLPDCDELTVNGGTIKKEYKIVKGCDGKRKIAKSGTHYTYQSAAEVVGNFPGGVVKEFKDTGTATGCLYCNHLNDCQQGQALVS